MQKTDGQTAAPADGSEQVTLSQLIDLLNLGGVPRSKLSEATYFTCLRVLSEGVSKLPLKLIRSTQEHGVEEMRQNPLYRILRYRPNPLQAATYSGLIWRCPAITTATLTRPSSATAQTPSFGICAATG